MGNRLFIFRIIFPLMFLSIYFYVAQQLFKLTAWQTPTLVALHIWLAIPFIMVFSVPYFFWTNRETLDLELREKILVPMYFGASYLSYILFFTLLRDILHVLGRFLLDKQFFYNESEALIILCLPFLASLVGSFFIFTGPFVKSIKLDHPQTPNELKGIKIVHLSDIHIGKLVGKKFLEKILYKTNQLKPDLVVLTGDIIDGHPELYKESIALLNEFKSIYGTFYATGNHEYYQNFELVNKSIDNFNLIKLFNDTHLLKHNSKTLSISGVTDPAAFMFELEGPKIEHVFKQSEIADFRILLAHQPNIADKSKKFDFHLQLSGHTHAGQFIPWSLMIKLFQKYAKGLYKINNYWIYVNQGTGFWGPPDRLGTFCEITLIEL